ncbi:MAG: DUF3035 domain-containing protein [Candidatus Paracaedibacter sp.]
MNKIYTLTSLLLCSFTLTGCDSFRNAFGLDHYTPNEWDTSAPSPSLILPPDFTQRPQLPPPNPGAPNPHVVPETVRAQKTVLGETHAGNLPASTVGERDIIEKSSKDQEVTPDIRKKLDEESQSDGTIPNKVISKLKSWKKEAAENLSLSKTAQGNSDKEDSGKQVSEDKGKATKNED